MFIELTFTLFSEDDVLNDYVCIFSNLVLLA